MRSSALFHSSKWGSSSDLRTAGGGASQGSPGGTGDGGEDGGAGGGGGGRLRRVLTAHARGRRSSWRKGNHGPKGTFDLMTMMKEPLRVVHSVPLSCASSSAAAADIQTSRRGLLWRRQYGSVELIPRIEDGDGGGGGQGSGGGRRFRVESGETLAEKDEMFGSPCTPVIENPEYQTRWYFKFFLGKLHHNYVGCLVADKEPFFLSVVFGDVSSTHCAPHCKAILWRKTGTQKISLSYSSTKPMTVKQILSNFPNMEKIEKGPKEIFAPDIQKDLLLLEEQEGSVNFKFGVLLCRPGQSTDDEMLSNEVGSADFDRFVALLGDKVRLKGWDKYRGGLDIKGDMTGIHSVYTIYEGHEVMFHVSTLLPYSKENRQQVERKRHIGNDIVNIVFMDSGAENMSQFNPAYIKSQFTHIFALVTYDRGQSDKGEENTGYSNANDCSERSRICGREAGYRLMVFSEESVPLFGPSLPSPSFFRNPDEFREFLLVKMINGEKAAFNTPTFAQKRERTLDMLLRDMYAEHMTEVKGAITMGRRALSDVISESTRGARRKEESRRQVELVRVGQALKLESIVKGDAPTSLATSSLFKRPQPWEPQCFYPDFHHEVICGDSWGESRLLVAAENGVHLVEEGLSQRIIFDKSVAVKQLDVVEAHGILLFRADKGRDCKVHVFRLSDFETGPSSGTSSKGDSIEIQPKTKHDLKEHRLERTRGCHLYALSKPGGSHLRMVVCVGRRLLIMQWRHSAAWTAWCPASDTDTVEGFLYLREVQVCEPPLLLSLVDVSPLVVGLESTSGVACVVGYKHQFDLVCCAGIAPGAGGLADIGLGECTPSSIPAASMTLGGGGNPEAIKQTVFTVETSHKPNLLSAIELPSDHSEPEVLLCYNNICHFQKLLHEGPVNSEFDFHWNSVPNDVVVAFPYVLALTTDCLEIRLIVNGNLVYTSPMPKLKLISAKNDIFFATTAPEFFQTKQENLVVDNNRGPAAAGSTGGLQFPPPNANTVLSRADVEQDSSVSPPPSPHSASPEARPFRFYRIPLHTLCGITAANSKPTSSQRGAAEREANHANERKTLAGKRGMTCTIREGYGREDQMQESRSGNLRARLASCDKSDLDDDDGSLKEETNEGGVLSSGNTFLGVAPPQKGLSRSCSSSPTPGPRPKPHQSSLDSGK